MSDELLDRLNAATGRSDWYGDDDFAASEEDLWQITAADDGSFEVVKGDYRQADGVIFDAPSLDAAVAIVTLLAACDRIAEGAVTLRTGEIHDTDDVSDDGGWCAIAWDGESFDIDDRVLALRTTEETT